MNIWGDNTLQGQYGLDVEQAIQDLLVQELTASIDKSIIDQLFNKQNIRKAKIDIVKEKIKSSE
jgi:hypothetical protein